MAVRKLKVTKIPHSKKKKKLLVIYKVFNFSNNTINKSPKECIALSLIIKVF